MKYIKITQVDFLISFSDIFRKIYDSPHYKSKLNPNILLVSLMAFSIVTSLSIGIIAPILSLITLISLAIFHRMDLLYLLKIILITSIFVSFIYLPMYTYQILITKKSITLSILLLDKAKGLLPLLLRTSVSSGILVLIIYIMGIQKLEYTLIRIGMPKKWVDILILTIIFIPIMLRELTKILIGRKSRVIYRNIDLKLIWYLLSTALGEIIIKGYNRAFRLQLTLSARKLYIEKNFLETCRYTKYDIMFLIIISIVIYSIILLSGVNV